MQYKFSPISHKEDYDKACIYLIEQLEDLADKLVSKRLPIDTLKVFAHYPGEFENVKNILSELGQVSKYSSATSFYVDVDLNIKGHDIILLGARIADPYRLQTGCGDYIVENFDDFQRQFVDSNFIRIMPDGRDMIELWHPNIDALGYIVKD